MVAPVLGADEAATSQQAAPQPQSPALQLTLSGRVVRPRNYTAADLLAMPITVDLRASGKDGAAAHHFTGVRLWSLLDAAGWQDQPGRKTHLQHVVLARGEDGYAVALSIAELDPGFEGKDVIVATAQDGKPLAHAELIVPGDRRSGRTSGI